MSWGSIVHTITHGATHPFGSLVGALGGNTSQQDWASNFSPFVWENVAGAVDTDQHHGNKVSGGVKHYHLWSNHDAHEQEQIQRALASREARSVNGGLRELHTLYGDYVSKHPDGKGRDAWRQSLSKDNAADRKASYEHYRQAYQSYFNPQLQDQFSTASNNDLFAGVNTGTSGGSADQIRRGATLNKYVAARGQIGARANQGVNDLKAADQQRELQLEDQIRHGGDAASLISQGFGAAQGALTGARQAIPVDTLGDVFNNAGNLYEQSQIAQGYGRRGLQFGNPSTSTNAGGSYSG